MLGCLIGLTIIVTTARAPAAMLLLCCIWIGICTWCSTLVRVEYAYGWALSGYTALILVVTAMGSPGTILLAPQFVIERGSEIILGVCCAVIAEVVFLPRSAKADIDVLVERIFIAHYQLIRTLCLHPCTILPPELWQTLHQLNGKLEITLSHLTLESSLWKKAAYRGRKLHAWSLSLLTYAYELECHLAQHPGVLPEPVGNLFKTEMNTDQGIREQLKTLYHIHFSFASSTPSITLLRWLGGMLRYRLLAQGIFSNAVYLPVESKLLQKSEIPSLKSAEQRYAAVNGLRAFIASLAGTVIWGWTGWASGSGFMVIIAVMCSLVMRTPNPKRTGLDWTGLDWTGLDFVIGMLFALPLGALYFY